MVTNFQQIKPVVWITGGGTGIGKALAIEYAKSNHTVVISGRRPDKLEEVLEELKRFSMNSIAIPCDVTDQDQIEKTLESIVTQFGHLDVVVANAGFSMKGSFSKLSEEDWRRQMEINFFGVVWTLKLAAPYLIKSKGRAAIMSSVAGQLGLAGYSPYCSSKFAVFGLGNSLYQEWYPYGVSVTTILPGLVESDIYKVGRDGEVNPTLKDTRPRFTMISAEHAAKVMYKAIAKRKREVVVTGHGKLAVFLTRKMPGLLYWAMAKIASIVAIGKRHVVDSGTNGSKSGR